MKKTIYPGRVWLDTEGKRIHAHGGSIFYEDGVFYWYGENKEFTRPGNGIIQWGVRYYASRDLCSWEDRGLLIPPHTEDPTSLLHPSSKAERPHILYCEHTGQYVCWMKVIQGQAQLALVLTAPSFTGPYTVVRSSYQPLGMYMGDFDLVKDANGKAYVYFERPHTELICAELTEDYTGVNGEYSAHFFNGGPPDVREAPAHFERGGLHYLLTSGTTGYYPNPSESAVGEGHHGPFRVQGDPHVNDRTRTSFGSQISSVFRHPDKKDLYIALGDRWVSDLRDLDPEGYDSGEMYRETATYFRNAFSDDEELRRKAKLTLPPANTSIADYVWLPLRFEDGVVKIDWLEEWSPEDYE